MEKTERFARAYYVAGVIGLLWLLLGAASGATTGTSRVYWFIELGLLVAWMIPLFSGGVIKLYWICLLIVISYFSYAAYQSYKMYYWLNTAPTLEGPNGEGTPLGAILGVIIVSMSTVSPWAFAFFRGLMAIRENKS